MSNSSNDSDDDFDETMTIDYYLFPRARRVELDAFRRKEEDVYEALASSNAILGQADLTLNTDTLESVAVSGFILDMEESTLAMPMAYPYWMDDSADPDAFIPSPGSPPAPWARALQSRLQSENMAVAPEPGHSSQKPKPTKGKRPLKKSQKEEKENGKKKATAKKHTGQSKKTVECELCHVTHNDDPRSKARHERSAQHQQKIVGDGGQEIPTLNCPQCNKVFTSRRKDSITRHLITCKGTGTAS